MAKFKVIADVGKRVTQVRDLFSLLTPLKDVPKRWLMVIEPHIVRSARHADCWMWTGVNYPDTGEPRVNYIDEARIAGRKGQSKSVGAKKLIAEMFIDMSRVPRDGQGRSSVEIVHLCGHVTCLNPAHLAACLDHWSQRDMAHLKKKYLPHAEVAQP